MNHKVRSILVGIAIVLRPNRLLMERSHLYIGLVALGFLSLSACKDSKKMNAHQYMAWFKDPDNGLTKEKIVNGYRLKIRYIPAEYLIYKELMGNQKANKDSIAAYYKSNISLVLSISPVSIDPKEGDRNIMYDGLEKFEEYKKRVFDLNFNMEQLVELQLDENTTLAPSIYNVENTYGLSRELNFNLVFSPNTAVKDFKKYEKIDIVLNDYIFETGINHFVFEKKELDQLPIL